MAYLYIAESIMAGLLENIDMRTRLAGHNRLELLLFRSRRWL